LGSAFLQLRTSSRSSDNTDSRSLDDGSFSFSMAMSRGEACMKFGRKLQLVPNTVEWIEALRGTGKTVPAIVQETGLSKASVYRALAPMTAQSRDGARESQLSGSVKKPGPPVGLLPFRLRHFSGGTDVIYEEGEGAALDVILESDRL
jgi:hypothetical protein